MAKLIVRIPSARIQVPAYAVVEGIVAPPPRVPSQLEFDGKSFLLEQRHSDVTPTNLQRGFRELLPGPANSPKSTELMIRLYEASGLTNIRDPSGRIMYPRLLRASPEIVLSNLEWVTASGYEVPGTLHQLTEPHLPLKKELLSCVCGQKPSLGRLCGMLPTTLKRIGVGRQDMFALLDDMSGKKRSPDDRPDQRVPAEYSITPKERDILRQLFDVLDKRQGSPVVLAGHGDSPVKRYLDWLSSKLWLALTDGRTVNPARKRLEALRLRSMPDADESEVSSAAWVAENFFESDSLRPVLGGDVRKRIFEKIGLHPVLADRRAAVRRALKLRSAIDAGVFSDEGGCAQGREQQYAGLNPTDAEKKRVVTFMSLRRRDTKARERGCQILEARCSGQTPRQICRELGLSPKQFYQAESSVMPEIKALMPAGKMTDELVQQYGGIEKIPDEVLREHGLRLALNYLPWSLESEADARLRLSRMVFDQHPREDMVKLAGYFIQYCMKVETTPTHYRLKRVFTTSILGVRDRTSLIGGEPREEEPRHRRTSPSQVFSGMRSTLKPIPRSELAQTLVEFYGRIEKIPAETLVKNRLRVVERTVVSGETDIKMAFIEDVPWRDYPQVLAGHYGGVRMIPDDALIAAGLVRTLEYAAARDCRREFEVAHRIARRMVRPVAPYESKVTERELEARRRPRESHPHRVVEPEAPSAPSERPIEAAPAAAQESAIDRQAVLSRISRAINSDASEYPLNILTNLGDEPLTAAAAFAEQNRGLILWPEEPLARRRYERILTAIIAWDTADRLEMLSQVSGCFESERILYSNRNGRGMSNGAVKKWLTDAGLPHSSGDIENWRKQNLSQVDSDGDEFREFFGGVESAGARQLLEKLNGLSASWAAGKS